MRQARNIIRLHSLPELTGLKRTRIQELIASGEFPKPFALTDGGRAKGIFEDDLIEWQRRRSSESKTVTRERVR
ncbi:helix-turn-helix transcriptional regulator [Bradyrhizobium sp. RDT46]|uniref:helix-turn-helix transcriptional regulator n=1 Tax=Bradyrhizobium sp. RDT46 TaxID=3341829 RepID=UPI0035C75389